jgi:hypothetical protein
LIPFIEDKNQQYMEHIIVLDYHENNIGHKEVVELFQERKMTFNFEITQRVIGVHECRDG